MAFVASRLMHVSAHRPGCLLRPRLASKPLYTRTHPASAVLGPRFRPAVKSQAGKSVELQTEQQEEPEAYQEEEEHQGAEDAGSEALRAPGEPTHVYPIHHHLSYHLPQKHQHLSNVSTPGVNLRLFSGLNPLKSRDRDEDRMGTLTQGKAMPHAPWPHTKHPCS